MYNLVAHKLLIRAIARKKYIKYDGKPIDIFRSSLELVQLYLAFRDSDFGFTEQVQNYEEFIELKNKLNDAYKNRHYWNNHEDWRHDNSGVFGFDNANDWIAIVGMINNSKK